MQSEQAEVIQTPEKQHVRGMGENEAKHIKYSYRRLKLGGG
jgi:hypothetical protein